MTTAPWPAPSPQPEDTVLRPYVDAIRSHLLLVIAVLIAALIGSVGWMSQRQPVYQAKAELLVTPFPSDQVSLLGLPLLTQAGDPTRTIQTAASLVDSHDAAAAAARRIGDGWTQRRVRGATDVTPVGQTNILAVRATAENGVLSARIANAFTRSVLEVRTSALREQATAAIPAVREQLKVLDPASPAAVDLQRRLTLLSELRTGDDPTLSISELAVAPASPQGSPRWLIVALAGLAGLTLGIGAALLVENLSREMVRTEDDLVRLFPLPILARLPDLSLRQSTIGVLQPGDSVRDALRTLQIQLEMRGKHRQVVMFVGASEGERKAMAVAAFGLELADTGASVILVDADLRRGTLRSALRMDSSDSRPSLSSVSSLKEPLQPVADRPSLSLLDLGARENLNQHDSGRVSELVAQSKELADHVIVDTSPLGSVSDALTLLDVVDDVVLVCDLRRTRRSDLEVARELLTRAGARPAGVVVIDARRTRAR